MKRFILIFLLLLAKYNAQSQILISLLLGDKLNSDKLEFGIDGGLTVSNFSGNLNEKYLRTFNMGFYFDFRLGNPNLFLNTGLRVKSNTGESELPVYSLNHANLDSLFVGGSITRKIGYFYVPVLLKYKFKNNIYTEAGIQMGLKNGASDNFLQKIQDKDDLSFSNNIRKNLPLLDAGVTAGIGYRLMSGNGLNLGIRYYYGLVNLEKNSSQTAYQNQVMYINVGIPVGKNPKK
jgi:hypothetical protein